MTEHGFVEERVDVDAGDMAGSMTVLYQRQPDAVYDHAAQWVRLRLEEVDTRDYETPDTLHYEVDTVADESLTRHAPAYTLTKELDHQLPRHRGLPLDDVLGYADRGVAGRQSWWTSGEEREERAFDAYGRVQELTVTGDGHVDGARYVVDLTAERRHLPGWSVSGTLERGPEPLIECLQQVRTETGLDLPGILDDRIDGSWNW